MVRQLHYRKVSRKTCRDPEVPRPAASSRVTNKRSKYTFQALNSATWPPGVRWPFLSREKFVATFFLKAARFWQSP